MIRIAQQPYANLGQFVIGRSAVEVRSSALRELIVGMAREKPGAVPCRTSRGLVPDEKRIAFQLESECGGFCVARKRASS